MSRLGLSSLCPLCLCGEPSSLGARLAPLAKAHKGRVAIAVKHLGTGETYFLNADEAMPTAKKKVIILGSGPEGWRAATPKAKFVIINLPFDEIAVGRMLIKKNKPPIFVIKARESQIMDSAVWWDAKKKRWRWEPGNAVN